MFLCTLMVSCYVHTSSTGFLNHSDSLLPSMFDETGAVSVQGRSVTNYGCDSGKYASRVTSLRLCSRSINCSSSNAAPTTSLLGTHLRKPLIISPQLHHSSTSLNAMATIAQTSRRDSPDLPSSLVGSEKQRYWERFDFPNSSSQELMSSDELEDCSPLVFSLQKRLLKFPHAKGHERTFPHVLLLLGEKSTTKSLLYGAVYVSAEDQDIIEIVYSAGMSDISKNCWLRHGNVGSQSLCLTSATASPSNTVKLINLYAVMKVAPPTLPGLKHPPLATTIHVQQMSRSLTSTYVHVRLTQSLARSQSLLEVCSPVALLQKVNQTSSCRGHERSFSPILLFVGEKPSAKTPRLLPPTRAIVIPRLFLKWSLPKLEDFSSLVFCFYKRLIKFPHVQGHERSIIDDAGSSSSHSATVSSVTALLTAETLALRNAMISARQCGINALLICSDFQILINLVKSGGRHLEIAVLLNDILSNLSKFVSLSLICFVLDFSKKTAHHYVDVVSILVFV